MDKFAVKLKRAMLKKPYKHMAKVSRHLRLQKSLRPCVMWKGKRLCNLIPMADIISRQQGGAFIVASGPSLKEQDVSQLNDRVTFGINGSIVKFIEDGIKPNYYVISDEDFVQQRATLVEHILASSCHCFFTPSVISEICKKNAQWLTDHPAISVFHNHFKEFNRPAMTYNEIVRLAKSDNDIISVNGRIGFSKNPNKGVFTAHTVIYFALQIAYGLGFRNVYLLGMDLGAGTGQTTRFYEGGHSAMPSHLGRDYEKWILPSFQIVSQLCKQQSLQVYNLSKDSRLPDSVIPKKSFQWALDASAKKALTES